MNYVKLDVLPGPNDWSPVIEAMKRGDYFWSSGEVLISNYSVRGTGARRTIVADVEWTFPLDFVEVVWGDGVKTERQIIPTTDLAAFGTKRFEHPLRCDGESGVRFAAWDTATNGAMVQPIKLTTPPTTARVIAPSVALSRGAAVDGARVGSDARRDLWLRVWAPPCPGFPLVTDPRNHRLKPFEGCPAYG